VQAGQRYTPARTSTVLLGTVGGYDRLGPGRVAFKTRQSPSQATWNRRVRPSAISTSCSGSVDVIATSHPSHGRPEPQSPPAFSFFWPLQRRPRATAQAATAGTVARQIPARIRAATWVSVPAVRTISIARPVSPRVEQHRRAEQRQRRPNRACRPKVPGRVPSHPIKGNFTTRSGEPCIYHVPGGEFYDKTKPERCYVSETDAVRDGCRRSKL
jgi:hypothetical protein